MSIDYNIDLDGFNCIFFNLFYKRGLINVLEVLNYDFKVYIKIITYKKQCKACIYDTI